MNYKIETNNPILIGDSHGVDYLLSVLKNAIPNDSTVIHVGDVGLGFGEHGLHFADSDLAHINQVCKNKNIKLFLLRGNHDHPDVWKFEDIFSHIKLLNTGDLLEFPCKKTALIACGGISVDRCKRVAGNDYWPDEVTEDLQEIPKADILISHDCPDYFNHPTATLPKYYGYYVDKDEKLMGDCIDQRFRMSRILEECGAKEMFYGHFHRSLLEEKNGVKARCLDINEVYQLKVYG